MSWWDWRPISLGLVILVGLAVAVETCVRHSRISKRQGDQ